MFENLAVVDMLKRHALEIYAGARILNQRPSTYQVETAAADAASIEQTLMAIETSRDLVIGENSMVVVRELRKIAKSVASAKNAEVDAHALCCNAYTALQMLDNISKDIIVKSVMGGETS